MSSADRRRDRDPSTTAKGHGIQEHPSRVRLLLRKRDARRGRCSPFAIATVTTAEEEEGRRLARRHRTAPTATSANVVDVVVYDDVDPLH